MTIIQELKTIGTIGVAIAFAPVVIKHMPESTLKALHSPHQTQDRQALQTK